MTHIYRFDRLLSTASRVAPPELQRAASEIAQRLRLESTPTIYTTSARLLPMVWWTGGRVRVLIPVNVTNGMSAEELWWILAHATGFTRIVTHRKLATMIGSCVLRTFPTRHVR